jgi:hypothetical protein
LGDAEEESALGLTDEVIEMELARAEDAVLCEAGATAVESALHAAGVRGEVLEPESLPLLDSGAQATVKRRRQAARKCPGPTTVTAALATAVEQPAVSGPVVYKRPKRGKKK